jgi:uncharacterized LabA/DUF88 family protein
MRAAVYVDGFNLYYIRLKGQRYFRWLNLKALADGILKAPHNVGEVNYYTAHVSHKEDPGAPGRQRSYLNALATVPEIKVHFGNFLYSEKWVALIKPPRTRPENYRWPPPWPDLVWIGKTEEKGSDVNLASHLVRDALMNRFDVGVVLSNDTDLVEPIRIAVREARKSVILLSPLHPNPKLDPTTGRKPSPAKSLRDVSSSVLHIHNGHLRRAQFPDRFSVLHSPSLDRKSERKEKGKGN